MRWPALALRDQMLAIGQEPEHAFGGAVALCDEPAVRFADAAKRLLSLDRHSADQSIRPACVCNREALVCLTRLPTLLQLAHHGFDPPTGMATLVRPHYW